MFRVKVSELEHNNATNSVVTIGNYDGLHLGHLYIIQKMNKIAIASNLRRVLVTFEPLPREFFADIKQDKRISRLSLLRDKYRVLYNDGNCLVDEIVILKFSSNLANQDANDFIQSILIEQLNTTHVVVGDDFRYGKSAAGGIANFKQKHLVVTQVSPYCIDDVRVSSSFIRQCAKKNQLVELSRFMGRNLHYTSRVVHGNHLGRKYGVPTINLCLGKNKPAFWGIYVAYVYIEGIRYNAIASIGKNPTISDLDTYKLEAHLFDIDLDLYGKIATVEILEFLRDELKFDNLELLFKQIYMDLDNARQYFIRGKF